MGDLAGWIHTRLGSGPANQRPSANGALGSILANILSKRAEPFAEDGTLPVDRESCKVIEIRPGHDLKTAPPVPVGGSIAGQDWPLSQARLQIEALASANRRKDEFLAMLSHELRSPLASMYCAMRVLRTHKGEASARERMQSLVERQLQRMTRLVDELLDISRITSGRMHLQRERVDLRVIVSHAIETLEANISERKHRLATELPAVPVWLQADSGRLEQVFVNLLANASRYTDVGGELSVWVHARQGQAVVRVRDSGIGIAAEALPHIFDLFKQGNAAEPRSREGLGVGLAVVRSLIELHGGTVNVASAGSGQGSEFTVRLPTET